ncbi:MAG: tetratricopeptide repeat protein, partial [Candidatus Aminicenantes bacterium]|nr:tetratricopeptide repeat protein [Candidatus Aminicenantes bacterium]
HKVLFEKAKFTMETRGDLQEAIKLFSEILEKFPDEREYAAQSQLYIGMCYERLGLEEAQKAYQDVVSNYPEQTEAVRLAREKLSVLQKASIPSKEEKPEFTIKKIWTGPEADGLGKISPDGQFVAFTDWTTGDLAVLDLTTGKKNRLTNKGNWMKSQEFALFLAWSPDGKQIAYNWWGETSYIDMRVIDATGSKPFRTVHNMTNPGSSGAFVIGWTPDGKSIVTAFAEEIGLRGRLSLVSIENGSEQIIREMDVRDLVYNQVISIDISPDGRWIAYSYPANDKNASNRDIYLMSINGKQNFPLIEHPACDLVIGWLPDGKTMLFKSDREGTDDVWAISVKDGKPDGSPVLIKEEIGTITPQGFDHDGSLYYVTSPSRENVYTAEWDPLTGEILEKPESPIKHLGQRTYSPSYSPDGKSLAYVSVRGGNPMSKEQHVICIRSLDTGAEREFKTEYKPWGRLRWSPDSHSILAYTRNGENQNAHSLLCLIDTISDETKIVYRCEMDEQKEWVDFVDFSPDGKSFYYLHCDDLKKISRLLIRDFESGNEEEVYRPLDSNNFRFRCALSPDRKNFVLQFKTRNNNMTMHILPATGGEVRELYSSENRDDVTRGFTPVLTWSKDGRYILFTNKVPNQQNMVVPILQLMRIPVEGRDPQALDLKMANMEGLSIHPDGKTMAFSSLGAAMKMPILWKMENFLPKTKDKK